MRSPQFLHFVEDDWDTYLGLSLFAWSMVIAATFAARPMPLAQPNHANANPGRTTIRPIAAIILGLMLALTSLANAAMLLAYPILLLNPARDVSGNTRRFTRRSLIVCALTLATFLLSLLPWTIYLAHTVGGLHYVRGSAQSSLYVGNLPASTGWADPDSMRHIPYFNPEEAALMLRVGETQYDQICQQRFLDNVRAAPIAFAFRCLRRIGYLCIGSPGAPSNYPALPNWTIHGIFWPKTLLNTVVACLGLIGIVVSWKRFPEARWIILSMLLAEAAYVPAIILDRYTLLLRALFLMMAATLFVEVKSKPDAKTPVDKKEFNYGFHG